MSDDSNLNSKDEQSSKDSNISKASETYKNNDDVDNLLFNENLNIDDFNPDMSAFASSSISDDDEEFNNISQDNNFAQPDINSSFEDEIDLNKEINFNDIEKLQSQIMQNMSNEFTELENDNKQEEDDDKNSVLKKYIVYISKDFVSILDNLSTNDLSAYINDAIQIKIDYEEEQRQDLRKRRIINHIIVAIITTCIMLPGLLYAAYESINLTINNYKYSQENFEKLYYEKFKKNDTYIRTLKYNKLHK